MAYCNKCGAYTPDGQSACLACGSDAVIMRHPEAIRAINAMINGLI